MNIGPSWFLGRARPLAAAARAPLWSLSISHPAKVRYTSSGGHHVYMYILCLAFVASFKGGFRIDLDDAWQGGREILFVVFNNEIIFMIVRNIYIMY